MVPGRQRSCLPRCKPAATIYRGTIYRELIHESGSSQSSRINQREAKAPRSSQGLGGAFSWPVPLAVKKGMTRPPITAIRVVNSSTVVMSRCSTALHSSRHNQLAPLSRVNMRSRGTKKRLRHWRVMMTGLARNQAQSGNQARSSAIRMRLSSPNQGSRHLGSTHIPTISANGQLRTPG
ncbi:hypothetical protein D3C77_472440 [compost metagenome]